MKNLKNKIAVVTGAASGIGRSLAMQFLNEGATVIACDINEAGLASLKSQTQNSDKLFIHTVDTGSKEQIASFAKNVLEKFNYIDILINNAGISIGPYQFEQIKIEDYERIIDINLWGVIRTSKHFLPALISRPEAAIVNISSVFGLFGVPAQVPYCTTKYAVRGFSETLRTELSESAVAITTVHPGGIKTGIVTNGIFYDDTREELGKKFEEMAISTPEYAAKTIIEGIKAKKKRVFIGPDAKLIYFFSRFWPSALEWVAKRRLKKMT